MAKISAIILTLNEEEVIENALQSLDWVDEIVVVDAGSVDKTEQIVRRFDAKFIKHRFVDFASQRNFAKTKAQHDLILYLDADEVVTPVLRDAILNERQKAKFGAFRVTRKNYYFNTLWPKEEHLERVFWQKDLTQWYGRLHESPRVNGPVGDIQGEILHFAHRNLTSMLAKTLVWSKIEAELRWENQHPPVTWWRLFRVMLTTFIEYYIRQQGYKVGTVGLIESVYQSYSIFITYTRLWELQQESKK